MFQTCPYPTTEQCLEKLQKTPHVCIKTRKKQIKDHFRDEDSCESCCKDVLKSKLRKEPIKTKAKNLCVTCYNFFLNFSVRGEKEVGSNKVTK